MRDPAAAWSAILKAHADAELCTALEDRMREGRLTFGGRVLCPFLRPFLLDADDEARVARASEALWRLGEQFARAASADPPLMRAVGMSDAEMALADIDPGRGPASTAARADAFILPDSLQFAEYNGESPAGAAYSQGLAELFDAEPLMARFRERFDARFYRPVDALLEALVASYREWGGTATPPLLAIVDWREVPTFSGVEMLRDTFTALGVPTIICDARDLEDVVSCSSRPPRPHGHRRRRALVA